MNTIKSIRAKKDLVSGACYGNSRLVLSAVRRGANVNGHYRGRTILLWAVQEGHLNVVKILIRAGASLERKDDLGFTPLDQAVGAGNLKLVEFLLKAGAKVNGKTANGSPLHTASAYGWLRIVKILLAHGANPHALDDEGRKPIYFTKIGNKAYKTKTYEALNTLLKTFKPLNPTLK